MSLTVQEHQGQLVVDSRLIATELGIEHRSFKDTINSNRLDVEEAFGILRRETAPVLSDKGVFNNTESFYFLTEDQVTYLMTLSRNTEQVKLAKRNLVKAFSGAKKLLQRETTLDSDLLAALLSKVSKLDALVDFANEYANIRKVADKNFPGMSEIVDAIADVKTLPSVKVEFTAIEWVEEHAPELTQRQRICFYQEIASAYRLVVDSQPAKRKGVLLYDNRHEIFFQRVKNVVLAMVPAESKLLTAAKENKGFSYQDLISLTEDEQSLIGLEMKLTTLSTCLGYNLRFSNTEKALKLTRCIKDLIKSDIVSSRKTSSNLYEVTPSLIKAVKNFHQEVN
jgi:phage regulator Rha-like protein